MGIRLAHATLALAPFFLAGLPLGQDGSDDQDRRVEAGVVRWHADFDAARAAAGVSGKPVLLFQLFGRLDEERC